jgi:hypothetical protein
MTEHEQLSWGSHMPALLACIGATRGPVLEIGCGHFSTPNLFALCGAMNRLFVSIEENEDWAKLFRGVRRVESYQREFLNLDKHFWSVVFIDQSGGGEPRAYPFRKFIEISDYVVVHDYHRENVDAIAPTLEDNRIYRHVTTTYQPPTLIASKTKPIPESVLHL